MGDGEGPQFHFLSILIDFVAGTTITAACHIGCAVVGAGILALPNSVAWLGWVAGPILIIAFYYVSLMSSKMLADCYETDGIEHTRYHHAVRHILGPKSALWVSIFQLLNIAMTTLAYTITGGASMQQIAQMACSKPNVDDCAFSKSSGGTWKLTFIFGALELVLSQVRNLEEAWWISVIGTISSFVYAIIALVLCLLQVSNGLGSVGGIAVGATIYDGTVVSSADKVFGVLNALGSIAFAYNFALILLEIQDTLKQPPSAAKSMKKACDWAITGSFVFYISVAISGYAAKGDMVAGLVLESFSVDADAATKAVLYIADVAVLAHMLTAFQVYGQAMFNSIESHVKWMQIKRAAKAGEKASPPIAAAAVPLTTTATDGAEKGTSSFNAMPTPFDAPADLTKQPSSTHATHEYASYLGFNHIKLEPLDERISSLLSGQITDPRLSSVLQHLHSEDAKVAAAIKAKLNRTSMFSVGTGFANEEVPLNEEHFYIQFRYRLLIRSTYVILITVLAAMLPTFSAMAGLVGAVTWYPLAIYFPYACYRKVKGHLISPFLSGAMWFIWWSALVVAITATVGSGRNVVMSFTEVKLLGT